MGFSLQEAQWLVKFYRNLPGQAAPSLPSPEVESGEAWESFGNPEYAMQMQAAEAYGYPSEEYYDEYW